MLQPKYSPILPGPDVLTRSEQLSAFLKQPGIGEVLEWTFLYDDQSKRDGTPYNTTFFDTIGGVSYPEWKQGHISPRELIDKVSREFSRCIEELTRMRSQLEKDSDRTKQRIEQEALDHMIVSLRTARSAVGIELEKSSPNKLLSDAERSARVREVEAGQDTLYGGKISENSEEIAATLELMCTEYAHGKEFLSEAERSRYLQLYARLIQELRGRGYADQAFPNMETYEDARKPERHEFTKETLERCERIEIPKARYMRMWQFCIDAMGFKQQVRENRNVSSIYDGPEHLEVPTGPSYESKNLKDVLRLMAHEVCAHYVNQDISEKNDFQIRGYGNVAKEEGLAILVEGLLQGFKLRDLKKAGKSYPYILVGETLSKAERQEFTELRLRMEKEGKSGDTNHSRDLRIMRGYPLDGPGAQRKDCSYGRGANHIIDAIETGDFSIMDFYKGKFSVDDIVSGRLDGLIPDEKRVFPLLIPEMILFTVGKGEQNFNNAEFMDYLRDKYAGDIPEQHLSNTATIRMISRLKTLGIMNLVATVSR